MAGKLTQEEIEWAKTATHKYCSKCQKRKLKSEFHKGSDVYGLHTYCKTCKKEDDSYRKSSLEYLDFITLVKEQNGQCAICKVILGEKLHADHDHKRNKHRGLLCGNCNRLLGLAHDSVEILINAAQYLISHEEKEEE